MEMHVTLRCFMFVMVLLSTANVSSADLHKLAGFANAIFPLSLRIVFQPLEYRGFDVC